MSEQNFNVYPVHPFFSGRHDVAARTSYSKKPGCLYSMPSSRSTVARIPCTSPIANIRPRNE